MKYQLLVLDLDGTLTNSKKEITKPTLEGLIQIQEAGKKSSTGIWSSDMWCFAIG